MADRPNQGIGEPDETRDVKGEEPVPGAVVGVDVGGTFTDCIYYDGASGAVRLAKARTTVHNQAGGVLAALDAAEVDLREVAFLVHGTTTTTNAVLERRLCKTGLITTAGFRDILELGRRTRPKPYGMTGVFVPVIPRDLRFETPERVLADGSVLTPLDEAAVASAADRLAADGCEAIVIHFIHSYANPDHERRAAEIVTQRHPNILVTVGHALLSESREFERGVTAAVNAAVQPLLQRYLEKLRTELARRGLPGEMLVVTGNGGMVSAGLAHREAAKTVMSGPASGVMAAAYTGRRAGQPNLITYDMGGTSSDVALIRDAAPAVSSEIEVEYAMPIHLPMVDVRAVGAGGGSIAWIDAGGLLQIGPMSAGADPGPIAYGRGGDKPTITDANLLLGRLNPEGLLSVSGGAPMQRIREVFAETLAEPLGMTGEGAAEDAASAVIRVANARMAGAIRMVSTSLGADPRDFALFAFGGAGPLHAIALARELGVPKVLIPSRPGATNALGCVVADLRHDFSATVDQPVDGIDEARVAAILESQAAEGRRLIESEPVAIREIAISHAAEMKFLGQTHLLRVELPGQAPDKATLQRLFEDAYFKRFRVELPEVRAGLVNLLTSVVGYREELDLSLLLGDGTPAETLDGAQTGVRRVWFESGWRETPIYRRELLPLDAGFVGPAIVEQLDTTIVIEPGDRVTSDRDRNLLVTIGDEQHDA